MRLTMIKVAFFYVAFLGLLITPQIGYAAEWYESLEAPTLDYAAKVQNLNKNILMQKESGRLPLDRAIVTAQIERSLQQDNLYNGQPQTSSLQAPTQSYTTVGIGGGHRE